MPEDTTKALCEGMVERVALALEPKFRGFGHGNLPMMVAREVARTAIEAMRTPTDAMKWVYELPNISPDEIGECYTAMIDDALTEGK